MDLAFIGRLLTRVFGSRNERIIRRYDAVAERIDLLEPEFRAKTPEQLRAVTDELRQRLREGATPLDVLPEAFAAVRDASRRAREHRHFKVQLVGGMVLYHNDIAEMKTGEGKTIVCHLALYLKVLEGKKAHLVTHNDFLVKRDAEFAAPIFELLGLTVGYIQSQVDPGGWEGVRKQAYAADVTYGTNNEFGFDYLRDNMKTRLSDQAQGRLDYAVVDEVDSLLIDEARTPLIISGPAVDDVNRYKTADHVARLLVRKQTEANHETARRLQEWDKTGPPPGADRNPKFKGGLDKFKADPLWVNEDEAEAIGHTQHFVVERDRKSAHVTHQGVDVAQAELGIGSLYSGANMDWPHLIENALRAHVVYQRDRDYAVIEGEVIIVDEFTGRLMHGRQWSDGLHQAVEAKENVKIKEETQTVATITIQNFFKLYKELAGMTGTAMTEADEFMKIYKLEVLAVPTNRPVNRVDFNDRIYKTAEDKYRAIVEEIQAVHAATAPEDLLAVAQAVAAFVDIHRRLGQDTVVLDEALAEWDDGKGTGEKLWPGYEQAAGDAVIGRPVLVGTTSIEKSEKLSAMLTRTYGIEHEVLNAKFHAREAEIVAKAGQRHEKPGGNAKLLGNVTIATNMAGRGTDIKLAAGVVYPKCIGDLGPGEGTPEQQRRRSCQEPGVTGTKCCIYCPDYDPKTHCAHCWKPKVDPRFPAMGRKVCPIMVPCGLHIVGTERHEARRIDNQLRGRSGRQGDPGSSRFFLSLHDELLKLFMGEWTLRMLNVLGFAEGMAIEDKRVSRGIERAQKKVEERNFSARKHLLEYDEVMDHQRRIFYGQRQQILQGRDLPEMIWGMIDGSISQAAEEFLSAAYPAERIAEWCRTALEVTIPPGRLDLDDFDALQRQIREQALDAARDQIDINLGEYVEESEPPEEWDLRGLSQWAQTRWGLTISQNQLRRMSIPEIREALLAAAQERIAKADLAPIRRWLDPMAGRISLADWARGKFGIAVSPEELAAGEARRAGQQHDEVVELLQERVRSAYREREIQYPVQYAMETTIGRSGPTDAYALERLATWANRKFGLNWSVDEIRGKDPKQLYDELVRLNTEYVSNGQLQTEIDQALSRPREEWVAWAKQRFGPVFDEKAVQDGQDPREVLLRAGREMLRYELTMLEQVVLLRIYDQTWQSHLYAMDRLKEGIGLRGYAERDPKIEYKREGFRMFQEMMANIREHVTDMIFKIQLADESALRGIRASEAVHHDATNMGLTGGAPPEQQAGMQAQGGDTRPVTQPIRRDVPKVRRNDPCPCGSGKKYKKCHGRGPA